MKEINLNKKTVEKLLLSILNDEKSKIILETVLDSNGLDYNYKLEGNLKLVKVDKK